MQVDCEIIEKKTLYIYKMSFTNQINIKILQGTINTFLFIQN